MGFREISSLRQWLSRWLALQTFVALGVVCLVVYWATNINLSYRQQALLEQKREVIEHLADEFAVKGDLPALEHKLNDFFYGKSEFSLRLVINQKVSVYGEPAVAAKDVNRIQTLFSLPAPSQPDRRMTAELFLDTTPDVRLRVMLAWTLFSCAVIGAIVVSVIANVLVRRALLPLHEVARQAALISPDRIGERLKETGLAQEIKPLVLQFNALLQRLERAYVQMEGFNADVAHELRTPLATLIGETEFALAANRSPVDLRDVLGSNLEELQRMTAIVNDMLFLSQADRGARARAEHVESLRAITTEVLEYHEAEALDARVSFDVLGDQAGSVDRSLYQRAISNLVSNAIRYSKPKSRVTVRLYRADDGKVHVTVHNLGEQIEAQHLPRLFYRFYRSDSARASDANHHGLGLAIVAAIARMHGGTPFVKSDSTGTTIGFSIAADFDPSK
ncbi:heavy metal sensor histidine kinase [Achromobacter mucicolens]|jgi:two-component system heavy metal sensor histidine kinase CusS|uniref:Sensor protein n=1 Tax=Achromobacter mucicolens TaxID=1389922 RepID=A0ABD4Z0P9_9BURK|nr:MULTISPECIES: heavy metal sensor histidine kinase [Achromobacter]MDH1181250.1 heavy metal sensor histidine kinase [Achromobacter mucicolens]CAB3841674.1 Adaptive-response sensory-kinase SasA [Achromobacter mucicolens]